MFVSRCNLLELAVGLHCSEGRHIYVNVVLLHSHFRVFSPECPLHTAINSRDRSIGMVESHVNSDYVRNHA